MGDFSTSLARREHEYACDCSSALGPPSGIQLLSRFLLLVRIWLELHIRSFSFSFSFSFADTDTDEKNTDTETGTNSNTYDSDSGWNKNPKHCYGSTHTYRHHSRPVPK